MPSIEQIRASNGSGNANLATVQNTRAPSATTIIVDTVLDINPTGFMATMGTPHTFTDPITSETITVISETTAVDFQGHINGSNIEIDVIAPGYTDAGSAVGDIVIIRPTTQWGDNLADVLAVAHNDNGTMQSNLPLTTPKITTSINDSGGNEVIKTPATASAVNEITVANAATGTAPQISATGGDTNIDLKLAPKGSGKLKGIVETLFNPYKFSVYRTAALTSSNVAAAVAHDTKLFDTGTNTDVATHKGRFTAPIDGFYYFNAVAGDSANITGATFSYLYKNGVLQKQGAGINIGTNNIASTQVSGLLQLSAGDYVEHYYVGGNGTAMGVGKEYCYFEGYLVSAA